MDARESSHESAAPKEQPPPESLRHQDRARLTVWKELQGQAGEQLEGPFGAAEGVKLSGAKTDGGGKQGFLEALAVAPYAGALWK